MKVIISKSQLLLGLQRVQNVVERKATMPILQNALLKTEVGGLVLSATDLEVGIQSILHADIQEPGAITVKARSLLDIVRELPETNICLQTKENNRLELTANRSIFKILGLPAEDFPHVAGFGIEDTQYFVRMNGAAIMEMLDKTLYAASIEDSRYHLNGVYFETFEQESKKIFRMVATDGHRLVLVDNPDVLFENTAWELFREGIIVPRKGLNELRRLLSEGKDDFFVSLKEKILLIKRDNIFISMRLIERKYADYRRIIPEINMTGICLERQEFLASIRRVSLMSSDKSKTLTFQLNRGNLQLSSQSSELGEAIEELLINYDGDELNIGFNSKYLFDAVSTMEGDNILLELRGRQYPGVLRSTQGMSHISVVMPMRM